jgi:diacylglycerol kinase family enzyme
MNGYIIINQEIMKASVILNRNSGTINGNKEKYSHEVIVDLFNKLNAECKVYFLDEIDVTQIIKKCFIEKPDSVVAGGGDGTVNLVASSLLGSNTPLGILPLGTLNHFAKDNKIPLDIKEAVSVIVKKNIKEIDAGSVNGKIFINNSSIGIYPKVVKHRDYQVEKFGGNKWASMIIAYVTVVKKFSSFKVDIHSNGQIIKAKTPFIFIGNNEYQMDLFKFGTREKLDEGLLDLYFPNTTSWLSMTRFAASALFKKLNQVRDFNIIKAKEVTISLIKKRKLIEVSLDGEVFHLESPLFYKIHPKALKVIVP